MRELPFLHPKPKAGVGVLEYFPDRLLAHTFVRELGGPMLYEAVGTVQKTWLRVFGSGRCTSETSLILSEREFLDQALGGGAPRERGGINPIRRAERFRFDALLKNVTYRPDRCIGRSAAGRM